MSGSRGKRKREISQSGEISRHGRREWYHFNLPRRNFVNNRNNYPARWHEDNDPVQQLMYLFLYNAHSER